MSLEATVADLVTATNALTEEVLKLLNGTGADVLRVYYASPNGAGSGLDEQNPTTLANALQNLIKPGAPNQIRLLPGEHVLPSATQIHDVQMVHFVAHNYNPGSPAVICTPYTTAGYVVESLECTCPSPSQTCAAHEYDEWPLDIVRSTAVFENISVRGTRNAITADNSRLHFIGNVGLKTWTPNALRQSACLSALESTVSVDKDANLTLDVYHPDYTVAGNPAGFVTPIALLNSTLLQNISSSGSVTLRHNSPLPVGHEYNAGILCDRQSALYLAKTLLMHAPALAHISNGGKAVFRYVEQLPNSQALKLIANVWTNADLSLGPNGDVWPNLVIEGTGLGINLNGNSRLFLGNKSRFMGKGQLSYFMAMNSAKAFLDGCTVAAYARASDSGFLRIINAVGVSDVYVNSSTVTTRAAAGSSDIFVYAEDMSRVRAEATTITSSTQYSLNTGAHYVDPAGVYH